MRDCLNREVSVGDVVAWPQLLGHCNTMMAGVVRSVTRCGVQVETHYRIHDWTTGLPASTPIRRTVNIKKNLVIIGLSERQYDHWMRTGEILQDVKAVY